MEAPAPGNLAEALEREIPDRVALTSVLTHTLLFVADALWVYTILSTFMASIAINGNRISTRLAFSRDE
jgi:hypothetical protein